MKIPWVNGPLEPYTEGQRHRTVNLRLGRGSVSIQCHSQEAAYKLRGMLIAAFQEAADASTLASKEKP